MHLSIYPSIIIVTAMHFDLEKAMNISFQHIRTVGDFKYRSAFLSLLVTPAVSLLINQSKRVSDLSNSAKMELDELQKKPPSKFVFFFFLFLFLCTLVGLGYLAGCVKDK